MIYVNTVTVLVDDPLHPGKLCCFPQNGRERGAYPDKTVEGAAVNRILQVSSIEEPMISQGRYSFYCGTILPEHRMAIAIQNNPYLGGYILGWFADGQYHACNKLDVTAIPEELIEQQAIAFNNDAHEDTRALIIIMQGQEDIARALLQKEQIWAEFKARCLNDYNPFLGVNLGLGLYDAMHSFGPVRSDPPYTEERYTKFWEQWLQETITQFAERDVQARVIEQISHLREFFPFLARWKAEQARRLSMWDTRKYSTLQPGHAFDPLRELVIAEWSERMWVTRDEARRFLLQHQDLLVYNEQSI